MAKVLPLVLLFSFQAPPADPSGVQPQVGPWRAWLESPGGALPFGLELARESNGWRAWIINGPERIEVPQTRVQDGAVVFEFDHYDSQISARLSSGGKRLDGEWSKQGAGTHRTRMKFHAAAGSIPRFGPPAENAHIRQSPSPIDGRWSVKFSSSDDPAVGIFRTTSAGVVFGTFMTTTGDYRFLEGLWDGRRLRLSCFDGAHAFLFDAGLERDGALAGDFWSRDSWYETWTARRDPRARLPDGFTQTKWNDQVDLAALKFRDFEGRLRSLGEPAFAGKARIIEVFGTWCPNCNDAAKYLVHLYDAFHDRGLSIVGLAFEHTGDPARDARQVRKFAERHGVRYPILVAGPSDKKEASEAFPLLDRIRSYPTTIFLHADGRVRAVHTGYTGPATGQAYHQLRLKFESIIEELLAESSKSE